MYAPDALGEIPDRRHLLTQQLRNLDLDTIFIHDIRIDTRIGVYDWERAQAQTVVLDLELALPHARACHSDQLADTIDYSVVVETLRAALASQHFQLLEALAEHIAQLLLRDFGTPWVRVRLAKIGVLRQVGRVGVCIERGGA